MRRIAELLPVRQRGVYGTPAGATEPSPAPPDGGV